MSEMEPLIGAGIAASEPVKRTMSPEHKAKMAEARAAKQAERSRGRPASRPASAPLPKERPLGYDPMLADLEAQIDALGSGEHLTRESLSVNSDFDVPLQGRREGWDYQWNTTHIMGQEVDPSAMAEIARGSWFPVPASHFPTLCPPGWSRPTIDRKGMRLYMRPMRLTLQARAEARQHAIEQKEARLAAAQTGDSGREFAPRTSDSRIQVKTEPLL